MRLPDCPVCKSGKALRLGGNVYRCLHNPTCESVFTATLVNGSFEDINIHDGKHESFITRPKEKKHVVVEINCVDCGKIREVKPQDKFQVTRCIECQGIWRKGRYKRVRV